MFLVSLLKLEHYFLFPYARVLEPVIIHVPKPEQTLLDDFGNVTLPHLVDRGEEVFFCNINRRR